MPLGLVLRWDGAHTGNSPVSDGGPGRTFMP